jgi:subtilisin family serine protease
MRRAIQFSLCLIIALGLLIPSLAGAAGAPGDSGRYIVRLKPGVSIDTVADQQVRSRGGVVTLRYTQVINGFSAELSPEAAEALRRDERVLGVMPDVEVFAFAQTTPTGVARIGTTSNTTAKIDGVDQRVNVDVAVLDTGVTAHPDLYVAGGTDCSGGSNYSDGNGHGTHVAGTIGALDNGIGVVGVAPGARIWSVRVLGANGSGSGAAIICGIDWVTANAATIEVANMSLGGTGLTDDGNCGLSNNDIIHQAICESVAAGVTYVVAAGNDGKNAATFFPACYDEVITVSALVDTDGKAGGLGAGTTVGTDDTLASFSNYGADVDVIAPGVNILSTSRTGGYVKMSGTSMASPHAAGAAALYKAVNTSASPSTVRAALIQGGNTTTWSGDRDNTKEPLIDVSGNPGGSTMSVTDITLTQTAISGGYRISSAVTVKSSGAAVSGATVQGQITYPNGSKVSVSGSTNASGVATIIRDVTATGTYTVAVTNVTKTGYTYAASANVVTSKSITISGGSTSMAVSAITLTQTQLTSGYRLTSQVTIKAGTTAVSGATVQVQVTYPNGSKVSLSGTTTTSGVATINRTVTATGTYTVAVTNVTKSGYTYTASANTVTSQSITIGGSVGNGAEMSVTAITLGSARMSGGYRVTGQVTVKANGAAVAGATVQIQLKYPNGSNVTLTGTTNSSGVATISRSVTTKGTYTLTVTNVTKTAYSYNPGANVVTSKSVTIT